EMDVAVRVSPKGGVTKSEPAYGEGWTVKASPQGVLLTADGAKHPYLFWESGITEKAQPLKEGFVVPREKLKGFLTEKLKLLGLGANETHDFLEYWWPLMSRERFTAVRFVPRAEIDAAAPLDITPAPKTVIRVLVDFRTLDKPQKLPEQTLTAAPAREGFTAVEWGGLRYR
ncbi:MAG: hypothetical protein U0228_16815, partial [Myxococcaceae bacterium]